jgi:hypothetical protein
MSKFRQAIKAMHTKLNIIKYQTEYGGVVFNVFEGVMGDALIMDNDLDILESVSTPLMAVDMNIERLMNNEIPMVLGDAVTELDIDLKICLRVSFIWHGLISDEFHSEE